MGWFSVFGLSIAGGIAAGVFLGGLWWALCGILAGLQIGLFILSKTKDDDNIFRISTLPILPIIGAILCGKLLGGFWWVSLGLFSGLLLSVCIFTIFDFYLTEVTDIDWGWVFFGGLLGAIIIPILAGKLIGGFLIILLGLIVGAVLGALCLYKCIEYGTYRQKLKELLEKEGELLEEEREKEAIRQERTLPFNERLVAIDRRAKEKIVEYDEELKMANEEYLNLYHGYSDKEPEDVLESFKNRSGFLDGLSRLFMGKDPGLDQLNSMAHYFNKRNNVLQIEALLISNEYTYLREKAILYVEQLEKITDKFSLNERAVLDVARDYQIKDISIDGMHMEIYNVTHDTDIYESDERKVAKKKFFRTIELIQTAHKKMEAFILRVNEINRSMEKSMEAFEKMYSNVNRLISNEDELSRQERVDNGGAYFNEKEKEEIKKLLTAAASIMRILDADL